MKKRMVRILSVILAVSLIAAGLSVAASAVAEIIDANFIYNTEVAERTDYNIVPGVTESHVVLQNDDGSGRVDTYVLEIDMSNPEIGIVTSYKDYMNGLGEAEWGMQALRDQAVEVEDYYRNTVGNEDFEVVAGVNGDFFNMGTGAPTGTLVMGGICYNMNEDWPFFAILDDGSCVIGDRKAKIPANAVELIGGPEVLIKDGEFTKAVDTSGYGVEAHPRTAIGIKADGSIVMVVSDGRMAPASCGQTFHQLAEQMLALGCVDALCLDGGGSASFISQREGEDVLTLRNVPSDGIERTVSTGLLIYTNTSTNVKTNNNKWFEEDGNIGYYGDDGVAVTGEQTIDGHNYFFDENGVLQAFAKVNVDGTIKTNAWTDETYYLGEDGMPVKGELAIGEETFVFDEETGELVSSSLKGKWFEFAESVCYFDDEGNKVTGEAEIGKYTYKFNADGTLSTYACVKDDGTLVKSSWVGARYLGKDGLPVTGEFTIKESVKLNISASAASKEISLKYTFDENGDFVKGALYKNGNYTFYYIAGQPQRGWHNIDGYWHYFDRQTGGGMATGENCDKVSIDYDKTDGLYTVSTTDAMLLFKFDKSGRLIRGAWLDTDYGKAYYWGNHVRLTGWQVVEGYVYYFNNDTYTVTGTQVIDGVEYKFNSKGRLQAKSENVVIGGLVYEFNSSGKVDHIYETETTEATCTTDGSTLYSCTTCDKSFSADVVPATGHDYDAVVTEPTIENQGYTTYTCKNCGDSYVSDIVGAIGHDYETVVTAPTCTEKGYTTYNCTTCEDSYVTDYVDATGHNYEAVVTAPTCTEKGFTTYTCKNCADSYVTDYVDATGHDHVAVVTPPTCTQKGYTTYICVCGDAYVRDYVDAGHTMGEWVVAVPAEVGKAGLEKTSCTVCGKEFEREIPALEEDETEPPSDITDEYMPGDINNDGKITAADARLVLRISAKLDTASDAQFKAADYNGDGKVTAADARLVLRKSAKLD